MIIFNYKHHRVQFLYTLLQHNYFNIIAWINLLITFNKISFSFYLIYTLFYLYTYLLQFNTISLRILKLFCRVVYVYFSFEKYDLKVRSTSFLYPDIKPRTKVLRNFRRNISYLIFAETLSARSNISYCVYSYKFRESHSPATL